ncbi:MAG: hypothetical protein IKK74_01050 [Clostridia bacterium]|nr:hypothetical protein [Clostridia bacterium]
MKIKTLSKIIGGQDGAIYKNYLFRFSSKGGCSVYDMTALDGEPEPISEFKLDKIDLIVPHSNSVTFGNEFFAPGDEFPLLYSNVYNNYAKTEDKRVGICCVYRLLREGNTFSTKLVQLIRIGFTDDRSLWRSSDDIEDKRPYGNFVVDTDKDQLWAFVMRDGAMQTRYFAFDLPKLADGEIGASGVREVTLTADMIKEYFDTPYHNYVQGAVCREGKIYSVEGFGEKIHPALRIIDTEKKCQLLHFDFFDAGYTDEAELIDFYGDRCIYGDHIGDLFELIF